MNESSITRRQEQASSKVFEFELLQRGLELLVSHKKQNGSASPNFSWCLSLGDTPVPFPNTEVKPQRANGTAGNVRGRVGPRQE